MTTASLPAHVQAFQDRLNEELSREKAPFPRLRVKVAGFRDTGVSTDCWLQMELVATGDLPWMERWWRVPQSEVPEAMDLAVHAYLGQLEHWIEGHWPRPAPCVHRNRGPIWR